MARMSIALACALLQHDASMCILRREHVEQRGMNMRKST